MRHRTLLPAAISGLLVAAPGFAAPSRRPVPARTATARPGGAGPVPAPVLQRIQVTPDSVTLAGPGAGQQLLVTGRFSDGAERDVSSLATFASTTPKIASVNGSGRVEARGNGESRVRVSVGKLTNWVKVQTHGTEVDARVSFRDEVIPALTRAGCNQGACHGAASGKGGFRLSLLGYDPEADYLSIVRQNEGRRVVVTHPEESLLLQKPIMKVPHGGGLRFKTDSREYQTILAWLRDGAAAPAPSDPEVTSVEVQPARRVVDLTRGRTVTVLIPLANSAVRKVRLAATQPLLVTAHFKDGSAEDVTRKAQFKSLNDALIETDSDGLATVQGRGATAVMVRYRGQATIARFTMPYRKLDRFPPPPKANFVDELVAAKWKEMGLLPSGRCTDAEFIRRAYLDVLGIMPPLEDVKSFLASQDSQKREKLVDQILARPEYVDYWTLKWGDLLRNNSSKVQAKGMWSFYNWLRASFRANKPFDEFARELITAQGSAYTNGPANYFRVATTPADLAETTSQVFLGVRLTCARCHHHPFEKWTQDDYWQMAAFFSRVGLKGSNEFGLFGGEQIVRLNPGGEVSNPRTGKQMKPTPLDGEPVDDPVDRRRALARWMTDPQNAFFARNIANRYWGYLMGRGIVDPVDDIRVTNPPSNPELLDALAKDFVAHRYDPKHLLKTILTSETYQLSANPTPLNRQDEVFYTKYALKRMEAEELLDAINFATETTDKFPNLPSGMRAVQLPDPSTQNYFLDTFGRPPREITCECERSVEPNMAQALHLMNSDFVQNKVANGKGRIARLLEAKKPDEEIVTELYLTTYCRYPTPEEATRAQLSVLQAPSRKEGLEDLQWALLNSREFLFKH